MTKKTSLFIVSMFALVLLLGVASAAITVTGIPSELSQDGETFNLNITNDGVATNVNIFIEELTEDGKSIQFNINGGVSNNVTIAFAENESKLVEVQSAPQSGFDFEFGKTYTTDLMINDADKGDLTFEETSFCNGEDNYADLDLTYDADDIKVIGYGDEGDFWYLMDTIEVEVNVEPKDYDVEDAEIQWELYTTDGQKIDDGDVSIGNIDKGDDETITFTFTLDSDIEDFDGQEAVLYMKAIATIDDNDADSRDGEDSCEWTKDEIKVITNDDFVIPTAIKINNEKMPTDEYIYLSCGEEVTINSEIVNIGEDDQDDVMIEFYSKSLEAYKKFEFDEIEAFESEEVSYTFTVPQEMEEGKYSLTIEVFDEDGDLFENDEDDESYETIIFMVEGNCKLAEPGITASLEGDAVAGKEMIIVSTITNKEDKSMTYTITAEGHESWAELIEIAPEIVILAPGESKDVTFTLDVKKDAEGEKFFNVITMTDGREAGSQSLAMNIAEAGFNIKDYLTKENLQIAGIVLLNLILVIAIIVVARKILKRK